MSKRTITSRSISPPQQRSHKKKKTAENDVSIVAEPLTSYATPHTTTISPPVLSDHQMDILNVNGEHHDASSISNGGTSLNDKLHLPKGQTPTHVRVDSSESGEWTKIDKRKEKKAKKEAQKAINQPPRFAFNVPELVKMGTVSIADVRDLTLHLSGDAQPPSWLRVTNRTSIQRIVVLLVPGITRDVFQPPLQRQANSNNPLLHVPAAAQSFFRTTPTPAPLSKLPFLSMFLHAVPTKAPGDSYRMHSVLHGFFMGPITGEERKRRMTERIKNEKAAPPPISSYILTPEQMLENEYPLPTWMSQASQLTDDWLQIPKYTGNDEGEARVLALDCEMCITSAGKELTHICIIDYATDTKLYDELVLPSAPITDYLTRYSGITPDSLSSTKTTLADVHTFLSSLLTPTTILLGHSLESDLKAMKVAHGRCLDTSVLFHHPRGRPLKPGLKWLMKKWVGKDIQNRGEGGHDPEEDARACIDLMKLKVQNGPGFGLFMTDVENVLERMGRGECRMGTHGAVGPGNMMRTAVVDYGNPSTWLGSRATSTVACSSDKDVVQGVRDLIENHHFVFGRMMELSEALGWTQKKNASNPYSNAATNGVLGAVPQTPLEAMNNAELSLPSESTTTTSEPTRDVEEVYKSLDENLTAIYQCLPPATAFLLLSGHDDPRKMSEMAAKKTNFENAIKEGKTTKEIPKEQWWTAQEGRELEDEVEKAKHGLLFLGMK
ncbi:hypothetical protein CPB86DRAFT_774753 [Serendipita vermifera]|nr:hypothetical protein CPB86DRAFT_774753 [Serendipita vermifera]